jgi:hypothetical protein
MKRAIVLAILALSAPARADDLRALIDAEVAWMESKPAHDATALVQLAPPAGMFAAGATFSLPDGPATRGAAELYGDLFVACGAMYHHELKSYDATPSADGKSAWVSFVLDVGEPRAACGRSHVFRVSELVAKTDKGWQIIAGAWSRGDDNARVNEIASTHFRAGRPLPAEAIASAASGDASVRAAVADLVTKGVDSAAQARKPLVVFGSAPGERTVDGKGFAAAWKAGWLGHAELDKAVVAGVAPSGTTAWAIANVRLSKKSAADEYDIPFRLFLVFDKVNGNWSLAHVHLAAMLANLGIADGEVGCGAAIAARVRRRLVAMYRIDAPQGSVTCASGKFRKVKDILPGLYAELAYRDETASWVAVGMFTPDGAFIISQYNAQADRNRTDYDETWQAIDLDGDGADEIVVDGHAQARADMHEVSVIDPPFATRSDILRYSIDLRPKEIPSYCEATMTTERAGKASHVIVNVTKVVGSEAGDQCLKKGRHMFVWENGKLVEKR